MLSDNAYSMHYTTGKAKIKVEWFQGRHETVTQKLCNRDVLYLFRHLLRIDCVNQSDILSECSEYRK